MLSSCGVELQVLEFGSTESGNLAHDMLLLSLTLAITPLERLASRAVSGVFLPSYAVSDHSIKGMSLSVPQPFTSLDGLEAGHT